MCPEDDDIIELTDIVEKGDPDAAGGGASEGPGDDDIGDISFEKELEDLFSDDEEEGSGGDGDSDDLGGLGDLGDLGSDLDDALGGADAGGDDEGEMDFDAALSDALGDGAGGSDSGEDGDSDDDFPDLGDDFGDEDEGDEAQPDIPETPADPGGFADAASDDGGLDLSDLGLDDEDDEAPPSDDIDISDLGVGQEESEAAAEAGQGDDDLDLSDISLDDLGIGDDDEATSAQESQASQTSDEEEDEDLDDLDDLDLTGLDDLVDGLEFPKAKEPEPEPAPEPEAEPEPAPEPEAEPEAVDDVMDFPSPEELASDLDDLEETPAPEPEQDPAPEEAPDLEGLGGSLPDLAADLDGDDISGEVAPEVPDMPDLDGLPEDASQIDSLLEGLDDAEAQPRADLTPDALEGAALTAEPSGAPITEGAADPGGWAELLGRLDALETRVAALDGDDEALTRRLEEMVGVGSPLFNRLLGAMELRLAEMLEARGQADGAAEALKAEVMAEVAAELERRVPEEAAKVIREEISALVRDLS